MHFASPMDAAVKRDHQAGKLALLGLSLLPSRAHIAVYHDRKDDIVIPVRVACLRKRPLSGTMSATSSSRRARGHIWCGHNMAKHIAGKALGLVLLPVAFEVSLFVLYNHPPTPAWCSFSSARPLTHGSLPWVLPPVAASLAVGGCFFLKH